MKQGDKMGVQIRKATLADAEVVSEMVAKLLSELRGTTVFSNDLIDVSKQLLQKEDEQWAAFLACNEEKCVGVITLHGVMALYRAGSLGIIQELYVEPTMRSEGGGEQLIACAKEHGKTYGWGTLEVGAPNPEKWGRTVAFYKRLGFKEIGPRLKYQLDD
mgnify:CR=1 FL=1